MLNDNKFNPITMKLVSTFLFFISCFLGQSQNVFQKAFGGIGNENAFDAKQTLDGGYILTGWTYSFGTTANSIYVIKTNSMGSVLWTSAISQDCGGCSNNSGRATVLLQDTSYAVVGQRNTLTSFHTNLIKLQKNGDTSWVKSFSLNDGVSGNSLKQTSDGGFIIGCITWDVASGNANDFAVIKTDSLGDILWSKTYSEAQPQYLWDILTTSDGGLLLVGERGDPLLVNDNQYYLIKTNSIGDTLWTKTYASPGYTFNRLYSAIQTNDGGYFLTGFSDGFGAGDKDIFVVKTDSNGALLWSQTFSTPQYDEARMGVELIGGDIIITGYSDTTSYIIKMDNTGNFQWMKRLGFNALNSVSSTSDGGVVLCGNTTILGAGIGDVYLVKTDSLFNAGCSEQSSTILATMVTSITTSGNASPQVLNNGALSVPSATAISSGAIQTDICYTGISSYSLENFSFVISPNPSLGIFNIVSSKEFSKIEIYNSLGEIIYSKAVNSKQEIINLTSHSKGIYFIRLHKDNKIIKSEKLIITE